MRLDDLDTSQRFDASVVATERLTPETSPEDVREITLAVEAPALAHGAGQCVGVIVPGPHPHGHGEHLRLYNVADTPAVVASLGFM